MLSFIQNVEHPNLLVIDFNDFICNYSSVSKELNNFLGLKNEDHIEKFKHFDPNTSFQNVGIYKNTEFHSSIQSIENKLSDLWDFC